MLRTAIKSIKFHAQPQTGVKSGIQRISNITLSRPNPRPLNLLSRMLSVDVYTRNTHYSLLIIFKS